MRAVRGARRWGGAGRCAGMQWGGGKGGRNAAGRGGGGLELGRGVRGAECPAWVRGGAEPGAGVLPVLAPLGPFPHPPPRSSRGVGWGGDAG